MAAKKLLGVSGYPQFTPIWSSNLLLEIVKLLGFQGCAKVLLHLCMKDCIKSFKKNTS